MTEGALAPDVPRRTAWLLGLPLAGAMWWLVYVHLSDLADALVRLVGLSRGTRIGEAVHFFLYDTPKVVLLLAGVVFVMGIVQTFFAPERTRALLAGRRLGIGNGLAALLGVVTPFCSCSAVPLFIGFVQAGVPLGITLSFLIAAPMVNEVALALLFALFGWKIALLYMALGLTVAIVAGWVIGRLKMEHHLEDWVRQLRAVRPENEPARLSWADRIDAGLVAAAGVDAHQIGDQVEHGIAVRRQPVENGSFLCRH